MKQLTDYGDERNRGFCVHCGAKTETRDHVPSKVFLDKPYPTNLPIVPSCRSCNNSFSLDEEYLACLIDCVLAGSEDNAKLSRPKVRRILLAKPALRSRLESARYQTEGGIALTVECQRVRNVILKLARGHAAFELNEPQLDEPSDVAFLPVGEMTSEVREGFETPLLPRVSPEVGSRAMQRLLIACSLDSHDRFPLAPGWLNVQSGRYRYCTCYDGPVSVRIVLSEYLACQVLWQPVAHP